MLLVVTKILYIGCAGRISKGKVVLTTSNYYIS